MRLDKLLSNMKYGSRKDIKKLLKQDLITINEMPAKDPSRHVNPDTDLIKVDGETVDYRENITLMMYKPAGVISATKDASQSTVTDLLPEAYQPYALKVAGRLDKDAEGLLILTTDGKLIHDIISPNKAIAKVYEVETEKPVENIKALEAPMTLLDARDQPYTVKKPKILHHEGTFVRLSIEEGKFHQIKRMFEHISHHVVHLKRVQINDLPLDPDLKRGEVKVLENKDLDRLIKK